MVDVEDEAAVAAVGSLRRRRDTDPRLLAFRDRQGWHPLRSTDINHYIKESIGDGYSAKDFRTWSATVLAAAALAAIPDGGTTAADRRHQVVDAVRQVSDLLGNTPAVCRNSYIDPRVVDRFEAGETIAPGPGASEALVVGRVRDRRIEAAVLELLGAAPAHRRPEAPPRLAA